MNNDKSKNKSASIENKPSKTEFAIQAASAVAMLAGGLSEIHKKNEDRRKAFIFKMNKEWPTSAQIFDYLAFSGTEHRTNSVPYLTNETGVDYYKIIKFLKHLDAQGIGEFVVGRKGKESRITWAYSPKSIGRVAIGKSSEFVDLPKGIPDYDGGGGSPDSVSHIFQLRKDFSLNIELPSDFNKADQIRLTNWLSTLPFD